MYANYHTHTYLCKHAVGDVHEYVENAINAGVKILGFSDHVPYPFSLSGYESCLRMELDETVEYIRMITEMRKKYADKIQIYIGYEAEYYPEEFDSMLKHITQFECDYLILGQHFFNNEYDGCGVGWSDNSDDQLAQYVDQVICGIKTGKFTYIAHPDVVGYNGDVKKYQQEMSRLCIEAKRMRIPLEINMLGLTGGRHYPRNDFWNVAAEIGNDVILGCDAHSPDAIGNADAEAAALKYAAKFGIKPIQIVELIRP